MPTKENSLHLAAPHAGEYLVVPARGQSDISFAFDTDTAAFNRVDNNLEIKTDNGGTVVLADFFVTGEANLPVLTLENGQKVAGADFLDTFGIDTATAAGPDTSASSHLSSYDSQAGNLLTGVDKLGGVQASLERSVASTAREIDFSGNAYGSFAASNTKDPTPAPLPNPVEPEPGPQYDSRAVLYAQGGNNTMALDGIKVTGWQWLDARYEDYFDVTLGDDGILRLTLKDGAHLPEDMQTNLYAYLSITTPDGAHTVQVIVNQSGSLSSAEENANEDSEINLAGSAPIYEWMQGGSMKAEGKETNTVSFSGKNDQVSLTQGMNAISGGKNTISDVTGNVVVSGEKGMDVSGSGSSNTITRVDGDVSVYGKSSGIGGERTYGGTNTIDNVTGNVSVTAEAGAAMNAWASQNTIQNVQGNVNLNGGAGMFSFYGSGKNTINKVGGNVTIQTKGDGLYTGSSSSENVISNVDGNVTVAASQSGNGYGIMNYAGKNTITNVKGDVNVSGDLHAIFTSGMYFGETAITHVGGNVNIKGQTSVDHNGVNRIEHVGKNVSVDGLVVQSNGGMNIIKDVGGNVIVSAGMVAVAGKNSITDVAGDVLVQKTGSHAAAISASQFGTRDGGQNEIAAAGDVRLEATATGGRAQGMKASGKGSANMVSAGNEASITATGLMGASGVQAELGGSNSLAGKNVSIDVKATAGEASGAFASGAKSSNTMTGEDISIQVESARTNAYGLNAREGGINEISATKNAHGIEVRISVTAGSGAKAYAMYASGEGSANTIKGSETGDSRIIIKGDLFTENGGKNIISTSGTGKNMIELDGAVSQGGLTLETHGGYDVLILRAADVAEFNARFQSWLKALGSAVDIDKIEVLFGDGSLQGLDLASIKGLEWLADLFGDKAHNLTSEEYAASYGSAEAFAAHEPKEEDATPASKVNKAATANDTSSDEQNHTAGAASHDQGQQVGEENGQSGKETSTQSIASSSKSVADQTGEAAAVGVEKSSHLSTDEQHTPGHIAAAKIAQVDNQEKAPAVSEQETVAESDQAVSKDAHSNEAAPENETPSSSSQPHENALAVDTLKESDPEDVLVNEASSALEPVSTFTLGADTYQDMAADQEKNHTSGSDDLNLHGLKEYATLLDGLSNSNDTLNIDFLLNMKDAATHFTVQSTNPSSISSVADAVESAGPLVQPSISQPDASVSGALHTEDTNPDYLAFLAQINAG